MADETVYEIYERLVKAGTPSSEAAKIAQEKTGFALRSGRPIKKNLSFTSKGIRYGEKFFGQYGKRPSR